MHQCVFDVSVSVYVCARVCIARGLESSLTRAVFYYDWLKRPLIYICTREDLEGGGGGEKKKTLQRSAVREESVRERREEENRGRRKMKVSSVFFVSYKFIMTTEAADIKSKRWKDFDF